MARRFKLARKGVRSYYSTPTLVNRMHICFCKMSYEDLSDPLEVLNGMHVLHTILSPLTLLIRLYSYHLLLLSSFPSLCIGAHQFRILLHNISTSLLIPSQSAACCLIASFRPWSFVAGLATCQVSHHNLERRERIRRLLARLHHQVIFTRACWRSTRVW